VLVVVALWALAALVAAVLSRLPSLLPMASRCRRREAPIVALAALA